MRRAPLSLGLLALSALLLGPSGRARAGDPAPAQAPPPLRVLVEEDGFYEVKAQALRALGYADDLHVRVSRLGSDVPVVRSRVRTNVVFLALGTEGRRTSFTLSVGAPPRASRAASEEERRALAAEPTVAHAQYVDAKDRVFGDLAAAERDVYAATSPTWFAYVLPPGGTLTLTPPPQAFKGYRYAVSLRVFGTYPGEVALAGTQGEAALGTSRAASTVGGADLAWDVAALDPSQPLVVKDVSRPAPGPQPDPSDGRGTLWIDRVTWTGAGGTLDDTLQELEVTPGAAIRTQSFHGDREAEVVDGEVLDGPYAVALDERRRPVEVLHRSEDANLGMSYDRFLPVGDGLGTRLYAARRARPAEPIRVPGHGSPLESARGAEHVIVSTQACLAGAQRLAAHRTRTGLRSVAVAATDIYEAFADGEQDPQALRAFLRKLREDSGSKTPRYVLLAGDAVRDRTDKAGFETIPALMARTQYNGATPADSLYVEADDAHGVGAPVVGRLPFREAATMDAFVDRLIAYESAPPVGPTRRLIRFLANEARFGPQVDAQIEMFFRLIVTKAIPAAYDVEVTFASPRSQFLWPPREFNEKVIDSLNEGALFYTYVGHGFDQGFDSLHVGNQRFRVLHLEDVPRVDVKGTPPVMVSIACTTAEFDDPERLGLGEALLGRPHGPIAFLGATRLCHPAGNVFLGRALAYAMFQDTAPGRRLGDVLGAARDLVLDPSRDTTGEVNLLTGAARSMLPAGTGVTLERLQREAFWLDNLLGDPGTRLPFPEPLAGFEARWTAGAVEAEVAGLPAGAHVTFTLEVPRSRSNPLAPLVTGLDAAQPDDAQGIRKNHRNANDKVLVTLRPAVIDGRARARLTAPEGAPPLTPADLGSKVVVKAWVEAGARVLLGATTVEVPEDAGADGPR